MRDDVKAETGAPPADGAVVSRLAHAPGRLRVLVPGVSWAATVAAVATLLGHLAPFVGAPVFAVVSGIAIAVVRRPRAPFRPGLQALTGTF